MSKLSRSENRTKWFSIVAAFEQSDLDKEQFCIEQQIKKATLDYWIRKSRYQGEESSSNSAGFASLLPRASSTDEIRLHFNGVDIFLPLSVDPVHLRNFVQSLVQ